MIGIIISCIGMLGVLILLTAIGFNIDWKVGILGIFLTITIIGVFLTIFI